MPSNLLQQSPSKTLQELFKCWYGVGRIMLLPPPLSSSFPPFLPPSLPALSVSLFLLSKESKPSKPFKYKVTTVPTHNQESQPTLGEHSISKCRTSGPMCSTLQQA